MLFRTCQINLRGYAAVCPGSKWPQSSKQLLDFIHKTLDNLCNLCYGHIVRWMFDNIAWCNGHENSGARALQQAGQSPIIQQYSRDNSILFCDCF